MKRSSFLFVLLTFTLLTVGCDEESKPSAPRKKTPDAKPTKTERVKRVQLSKNIFLEVQGKRRRVMISAKVCLTRGPLELFMTKTNLKEHEAVVAADVDARDLKRALLAAGAKEGEPVQFEPKYVPAHGQKIKVTVLYEKKGKLVEVPAQKWIYNNRTKKALQEDWVFGGSHLVPNPLDPNNPVFLANDGDLICISNFESALLDLPVKSTKVNDQLEFECNTKLIPKMDTAVTVILEPVGKGKD